MQLERYVTHDLAQPPLDGCVHVLVREGPREPPRLDLLQHSLEPPHQLLGFFSFHNPLRAEHQGVGDRTAHVVGGKPYVERDGGVEPLEGLRRGRPEPAAP